MNQKARVACLATLLAASSISCQSPRHDSTAPPAPRGEGGVEAADVAQACRHYATNNFGRFPENLESLTVPDSEGVAYIQNASAPLVNPWGQPFTYHRLKGGASCRIASYGRDGVEGGVGADKDFAVTLTMPRR